MKKIQFQILNLKFLKNISGRFIFWRLFVVYYLLFGMLGVAGAEMRSSSYVIYENVHHSFDGPVISSVASVVSLTDVTISWNTDVAADSFVIYSTDSALVGSMEQGTSIKTFTSHSVDLAGLLENTTYYYRVRSTRVNGGVSVDNTIRSFTTGAIPAAPVDENKGGGMLIIDKTDKIAPLVSNISIVKITASTAEISWETDEEATSFVEYSSTSTIRATYGAWEAVASHKVVLVGLQPSTSYRFRVLSSDTWGNATYSVEQSFITLSEEEEEKLTPEEEEDVIPDTEAEKNRLEAALAEMRNFFSRLFPAVSLNELSGNMANINSLADLNGFIPAPILSGEPRIEVDANGAKIFWTTDIDANSLVAMAPAEAYHPGANEPYLQIVGNSEEKTRNHEVNLYGLLPNTEYHFQLRSKAESGPMAKSQDFTFRTSLETLNITSFFSKIIDNETAVFKWVTNKEADSAVNFAPYQGNVLAVEQSKTIKDTAHSTIHEVEIKDFEAGMIYGIELVSADADGNSVSEQIVRFSTSEEDVPPAISHIKTDSTIFVDRSNKIQTVISWITNEPSTSQVYFQEGVHGGQTKLDSETIFNTDYTKEHVVVISKFKPGIVYSFQVESIDSGGNVSISKIHTFMTAKKKESIIQVIMKILEDTFGWVKKLM